MSVLEMSSIFLPPKIVSRDASICYYSRSEAYNESHRNAHPRPEEVDG